MESLAYSVLWELGVMIVEGGWCTTRGGRAYF